MAAEEVCQEAVVVETERLCCSENHVEPPYLKRERRFRGSQSIPYKLLI